MSRREKAVERFKEMPENYRWDELENLLKSLDYEQKRPGKTAGSRRRFVHATAPAIVLHRPHAGRRVKRYALEYVMEVLTREGLL